MATLCMGTLCNGSHCKCDCWGTVRLEGCDARLSGNKERLDAKLRAGTGTAYSLFSRVAIAKVPS